jgi:hypothetical protein
MTYLRSAASYFLLMSSPLHIDLRRSCAQSNCCKAHALVALAWEGKVDAETDLGLGEGLLKSILRDLLALAECGNVMSAGNPQHSQTH